ncbi:MAG: hypothetical protein WAZ14_02575 [Patescibacteria group bacterium]
MDRHWFPAILLGMTVILAVVFAAVLSPKGQEFLENNQDVREVTVPSVKVNEETYTQAVSTLLEAYQVDEDPEATYNALIAVRVPGNMLNVHYELVVAFGKLVNGETDDGTARLAALKAQYSWLPL